MVKDRDCHSLSKEKDERFRILVNYHKEEGESRGESRKSCAEEERYSVTGYSFTLWCLGYVEHTSTSILRK